MSPILAERGIPLESDYMQPVLLIDSMQGATDKIPEIFYSAFETVDIEVIHIPTSSDIGQEQWQKAIQAAIDNKKAPIVVAEEFKQRPAIAGNNGSHDIKGELLGIHGEVIEKTLMIDGRLEKVKRIRILSYFLGQSGDLLAEVYGETVNGFNGRAEKVIISEIDPKNARYTVFSSFDTEAKDLDQEGEHVVYQAA